jgi:hypothetical protein
MSLAALAVSILMKNPNLGAEALKNVTAPGVVDTRKMHTSIVDLSRGVLTCYHKSARFQRVDKLGVSWNRQEQYGAENSIVLRIHFTGFSQTPYFMDVAALVKEDQLRTVVLFENSLIRSNKKCELEEWTS